jgi:hypothetical protein
VYAVCSLFAELTTGVTDVTMSATFAIELAVRPTLWNRAQNPLVCARIVWQAGPTTAALTAWPMPDTVTSRADGMSRAMCVACGGD